MPFTTPIPERHHKHPNLQSGKKYRMSMMSSLLLFVIFLSYFFGKRNRKKEDGNKPTGHVCMRKSCVVL